MVIHSRSDLGVGPQGCRLEDVSAWEEAKTRLHTMLAVRAPIEVASGEDRQESRTRLRRSAFPMTVTELSAIAAPAMIGLRRIANSG